MARDIHNDGSGTNALIVGATSAVAVTDDDAVETLGERGCCGVPGVGDGLEPGGVEGASQDRRASADTKIGGQPLDRSRVACREEEIPASQHEPAGERL
ncbi:MAG: hypothetical protein ACKOTB_12280, partial [Planctomycetia bacterium]